MRRLRLFAAVCSLFVVALVPVLASAVPTCPAEATRAACGNRVIAPALQSVSFLQYGQEYKPALDAIAGLAPEIIDVQNLGKSFSGRDVYAVRVTDESVTSPKRQVAISLSVHANESAGREGGLRYLEDLARWWRSDKGHKLYTGDTGIALDRILAETEIYLSVVNVDGWAVGDVGGGNTFVRGNGRGVDLNRDFPTIGWTKRTQLSEPESRLWDQLVSSLPNLTTAADIHGELTSANNAFSDLMYPAGQWSPTRQAQELQLARNMTRTVERKFAEEGVVLQTLFDLAGDDRPMKPANFATAYDVVGYDDSGFMGDYFVSKGAVEIDVENFLSHMVPGNVWVGALEQAHVAAVKGNMESIIAESMITGQVQPTLDLGRVAYIDDPARVTREARPGATENQAGYSVSRLEYFADLAADAGVAIEALPAGDVATTDLSQYDSIVLADTTLPQDTQGRAVDQSAYYSALDAFTRDGGQLVLTDAAVNALPRLGVFPETDIKTMKSQAGHVNFGTLDHPWEADLEGVPSQTYYAVPLGYRSSSSIKEAPHWGVTSSAWDAKGGTTVGTVSSDSIVNLGHLSHGDGSIAIFGAILPTQTQANRHDFGLADYAVTVSGGQVFHEILSYRR